MPRWMVQAIVLAASFSCVECRARSMRHTSWTPLFGPVVSDEVITGRASQENDVWLATSLDVVVHLNLPARTYKRIAVRGRAAGEHIWGLALAAGRLWTLLGPHTLAEIDIEGAIKQRIALVAAHVELFGRGTELVYQVVDSSAPADALAIGPPGEAQRRPWAAIRTRRMPLERGGVAVLNHVSCSTGRPEQAACWFPDEAALSIVNAAGESRRVELEGLPLSEPEVLLTSEAPRKPIRDALVTTAGGIWVVGSGRPPSSAVGSRPGGWLLATYTAAGQITRRLELPEPVRLLLQAGEDRCVLLTSNGWVVQVRP